MDTYFNRYLILYIIEILLTYIRPCLQGGRVTLVLGLPLQEGYPSTSMFLPFSHHAFTRQVGITLGLG